MKPPEVNFLIKAPPPPSHPHRLPQTPQLCEQMCVCVHELTCISLYEHMGCVCVLLVSVLCAYVNVMKVHACLCAVCTYTFMYFIYL